MIALSKQNTKKVAGGNHQGPKLHGDHDHQLLTVKTNPSDEKRADASFK